ncbi:MAG: hypothetical protein ABSG64_03910 [Solirubrobacteraceae bacterium]|jgi:hypothetical protein
MRDRGLAVATATVAATTAPVAVAPVAVAEAPVAVAEATAPAPVAGALDWPAVMSEAESPARAATDHRVTVEDVRQLMGASTPHFALQLSARIAKLIAGLGAEDPARLLGEQEIARLAALAVDGETRGGDAQDGQRSLASVRD